MEIRGIRQIKVLRPAESTVMPRLTQIGDGEVDVVDRRNTRRINHSKVLTSVSVHVHLLFLDNSLFGFLRDPRQIQPPGGADN